MGTFASRVFFRLRLPGVILFLFVTFVFVGLALAAPVAQAQTFDASNLRQPADLDNSWRFHAGDDPAYATPDFDDSQWKLYDPHTDIKNLLQSQHPAIVWYRLRVKVSADQTGLALREHSISRAFEIYVNGERLIAEGQITPVAPYTLYAYVVRRIPERLLADGTLLIALRVHISASEWNGQVPGYSAGNLTIGQEATLYRDDWLTLIGDNSLLLLDRVLSVCLGVVAMVLFAAQRRNTEYLWIAAAGLLDLMKLPEQIIVVFRNIPLHWEVMTDLLRVATPFLLAGLFFSFVHQKIGWRWRIFLIFAGVMNVFNALQGVLFISSAPVQLLSNLPLVILLSVILPIVMTIHWRRGNREAGILMIPVVLLSLYVYVEMGLGALFQFPAWRDFALHGLNMIDRFPAGPFALSANGLSGIMATVALAVIMLRRSMTMSRRQALLEGELAAAQQVQQVLLPEQGETVPGFAVETVYQPAQQVGGDFFQILPAAEGGLLVVVGDVAGKGLPAAMLVSVLVGTIRGVAEYTTDPAELLTSLNERLVGRGGGSFSTALAAHIAASGAVTIANAGHLSPYLDGKEVELAGALPLGVVSGAVYAESHAFLGPGSRLTLYSDGVIEAQNQHGELFGFERAQAISTQPAAAIVEAARKFGQEDDITVVTIARDAAVANAA